jgi:branched-subunit amino acid ABC-type transport system permease component
MFSRRLLCRRRPFYCRRDLVLTVVLGVMLARLAGVMGGVRRMAMRRMGVMRGLLVAVRLGGFAMVLGGALMMLGRGVVMLDDFVFGHDALHPVSSD